MRENVMTRATDAEGADQLEEHQLIRAAQADLSHFGLLYDRYIDRVYRYIVVRVKERTTAEDLTSQVFLRALEGLPHYRPDASFAAWLFTIARNTVISHIRQERPTFPYDETLAAQHSLNDDFPDELGKKDEWARLFRLLEHLGEDERELLYLRFAAGLSTREVSYLLGKSQAAVKVSTYRLLRRLQREMEKAP